MATVREATFELFREHGMTTIFGNPGSTELPMLAEFPDDFRYVLGLQEAVVVGWPTGTRRPRARSTHVNLHTAPGVGNAMGAIFNAQANKSPLLVTAGQQVRAQITMQANLTNRDATRVAPPVRQVELRAAARRGRAAGSGARHPHGARLPPRGPAFVSRADGRLERRGGRGRGRAGRRAGSADARAGADPEAIAALAERLDAAESPVMVAGPDIDAAGAWDDAVALAERQKLPVFASPGSGWGPARLPRGPPLFQGVLPPAIGPGRRDAARART